MKNYMLFWLFFLVPFSCVKEEKILEISNSENTMQIESYKRYVRNSHRNKSLNPKLIYKKWQKAMKELSTRTNDVKLLQICQIAKKIKLADEKETSRRGFLIKIGTDEVFPLAIFFTEKADTTSFLSSVYDPNTNLIIIFDYKNITKFGENLSAIASVYSHEIDHSIGFQNQTRTENEDHVVGHDIEKSVLLSFYPELLDSLKFHHAWGSDSTAQKFIGEYFATAGEIDRVNAKNIYFELKINSSLPPPSE